ncbi:MAG: hypothetical protein ACE5F7_05030, partial [Nitrospiria bacterium]
RDFRNQKKKHLPFVRFALYAPCYAWPCFKEFEKPLKLLLRSKQKKKQKQDQNKVANAPAVSIKNLQPRCRNLKPPDTVIKALQKKIVS